MTGQLDNSVYFYPANYIHMTVMSGRSGMLQSANDVARFEYSHDHRPISHTLAGRPTRLADMAGAYINFISPHGHH